MFDGDVVVADRIFVDMLAHKFEKISCNFRERLCCTNMVIGDSGKLRYERRDGPTWLDQLREDCFFQWNAVWVQNLRCQLDDFVLLSAVPCSLQIENNIENLVPIQCRSILNNCCFQRRFLRGYRNTVGLDHSFSRCLSRCSTRTGRAVVAIMPFSTTTTTLPFLDGCFTLPNR